MNDRPIEQYVARPPRHSSTPRGRLWIEADLTGSGVVCPFDALLVNLSRNGILAQVVVEFPLGLPVTIRICSTSEGLNLTATGDVRWRHEEDDGSWSVGCEFHEPVEMEVIGELFLHELLE